MNFVVEFTPNARSDIKYFRAYEQRMISQGTRTYLSQDADVETGKIKQLEPNAIATWELRIDHYRVFYDIDIDETTVFVIAVGYKVHNDLYIQGRKVVL